MSNIAEKGNILFEWSKSLQKQPIQIVYYLTQLQMTSNNNHRYCRGSGSDSFQSTNSFTSFINVINFISLLGEVQTFLIQRIQVTCTCFHHYWSINEIKSRTFSRLCPGYYLFWLSKRNTTHKIPRTSTVYWVAWIAEIVVFGINIYLNKFNIKLPSILKANLVEIRIPNRQKISSES
jgi:hypothetical protein